MCVEWIRNHSIRTRRTYKSMNFNIQKSSWYSNTMLNVEIILMLFCSSIYLDFYITFSSPKFHTFNSIRFIGMLFKMWWKLVIFLLTTPTNINEHLKINFQNLMQYCNCYHTIFSKYLPYKGNVFKCKEIIIYSYTFGKNIWKTIWKYFHQWASFKNPKICAFSNH